MCRRGGGVNMSSLSGICRDLSSFRMLYSVVVRRPVFVGSMEYGLRMSCPGMLSSCIDRVSSFVFRRSSFVPLTFVFRRSSVFAHRVLLWLCSRLSFHMACVVYRCHAIPPFRRPGVGSDSRYVVHYVRCAGVYVAIWHVD